MALTVSYLFSYSRILYCKLRNVLAPTEQLLPCLLPPVKPATTKSLYGKCLIRLFIYCLTPKEKKDRKTADVIV